MKKALAVDERGEAAVGVTGCRVFDLDDVGTEIDKHAARQGTGHITCEIQHLHRHSVF